VLDGDTKPRLFQAGVDGKGELCQTSAEGRLDQSERVCDPKAVPTKKPCTARSPSRSNKDEFT